MSVCGLCDLAHDLRLALLFLIAGYGSHAGKISHFWPQYIAVGSIGKYINQTRVILSLSQSRQGDFVRFRKDVKKVFLND